ncbi:MAG: HPr family phosphocarrier protein [Solobacterium sp.]|jgi:phosphocarrier protein|nr:HPr family phosphocarrier protein [Solobacterium sp.]MBQ6222278.1 HPr family phosphocarrier protein [Solobacterium sp.]MBR2670415.1 HPr family phosphocarrier protein [Solobacterium sp.]
MKEFKYLITDPIGIHARPAGLLAKLAKSFEGTTVFLTKGDQTVKASQLMKLMNLGVKAGDEVTIQVEGGDEDAALAALEAFLKENL